MCCKGSGSSSKGGKGRRVSLRSSQSSWMMLLSGKDRKPRLLPARSVQERTHGVLKINFNLKKKKKFEQVTVSSYEYKLALEYSKLLEIH